MKEVKVVEGSEAVALAVKACRPHVISAFPISPQTHIVESLARMVADGELKRGIYPHGIRIFRGQCSGGRLGRRKPQLYGLFLPGAAADDGSALCQCGYAPALCHHRRQPLHFRAHQYSGRSSGHHVPARCGTDSVLCGKLPGGLRHSPGRFQNRRGSRRSCCRSWCAWTAGC